MEAKAAEKAEKVDVEVARVTVEGATLAESPAAPEEA